MLEILDWNNNFIEGAIPLVVGRLQRLKILRLHGNKLSESFHKQFSTYLHSSYCICPTIICREASQLKLVISHN
ncbi:hypothetical protein K1719_045156 [Acacia pycnantha]|nr:hypothetical protein K1719_045156 [Acacia pycnantha]